MHNSFLGPVRSSLQAANRWLLRTPERALNEAYEAALRIKGLEDAHFNGNRILLNSGNYSKSAQAYFQGELKKYLNIIKVRLIEFKASRSVVRLSNQSVTEIQLNENATDLRTISVIDQPNLILKKLRFIDDVVARYEQPEPGSVIIVTEPNIAKASSPSLNQANGLNSSDDLPKRDLKSITDKTGVLPRSILETVDRIKRDLDPQAEQEVLQDFRVSRSKTIISIRLVLLMIIIPLLTQQISKNFLVGPIVDRVREQSAQESPFLNYELEEEALNELQRFEQRLRFEILIGKAPPIGDEAIVERVRERASEIEAQYRRIGSDAIKNVFSDLLGLLAFVVVIVTSKREIAVLKSFMDTLIYGLSDSAKAFIIILFTDIFVGFHSPHGWEVLLESVSRHLGLPANRDFIFLFIATFPVILDTIFKYWIFRYLNRVSPSAVATYRNMNE
ncbi:proton extrusion protein PcxA [Leptolyngbya sp. NK1-12]|uniref:Proton extrusion protein PxcA n=1 Tax=Leptolyngbya sp. NK1-12 TaxID=2547451 RepID=A0AA96WJ18_9CYAN|nr:proton extrusion protein PcxA [Leptolyngbya sp. NK1-12]WNZ26044.1 proton extrusion protein PcxA [Leptolyngbya sp. NK1-12]